MNTYTFIDQLTYAVAPPNGAAETYSDRAKASVAWLDLTEDRKVERAARFLIEQLDGIPVDPQSKVAHPFFRLSVKERFLLVALHQLQWPYDRIARTIGLPDAMIASLAWSIRIRFVFEEMSASLPFPSAPLRPAPACPTYDPSAPWMQGLLDPNPKTQHHKAIQTHIGDCPTCRSLMEQARHIWERVLIGLPETKIPEQTQLKTTPRLQVVEQKIALGLAEALAILSGVFALYFWIRGA